MTMNVGELLRERDRLLGVIEEAKSARSKLKQINVLIAMYGDAEHVELLGADAPKPRKARAPMAKKPCPECGLMVDPRGVPQHMRKHKAAKPTATRRKATA